MNHFYLFALIINLLVGSYVFFFINQQYIKNRTDCLRTLKIFTLLFNLLIVAFFSTKYVYTNILQGISSSSNPVSIYRIVVLALYFFSEFGVGLYIFRTTSQLKEKVYSKLINRIYFLYGGLFFILYVIGMYNEIKFHDHKFRHQLDMVWELSVNIFIIFILLELIYFSFKRNNKRNAMRPFGYIFLAGFLAYLLPTVTYNFFGKAIGIYVDPINLLYINAAPWIWLNYFYLKQVSSNDDFTKIDNLYPLLKEEFSISKREFEIIKYIMLGKSNQELCDILFISFHTVKNHIYNIFKKLDVNSRSQLIHFINNKLEKD